MSVYDLPTSLTIGGVGYPIRYGWRAVVDVLDAFSDPEMDEEAKVLYMLMVMYPTLKDIPERLIPEACEKAAAFIDCGQKEDGNKPKLIDWRQDASIIISEINNVAKREIRLDPNIHWWTVFSWFMSIGDGRLASVLHIRQKKARHKKLEKWEQEYYRKNKHQVDLKKRYTAEELAEQARLKKLLGE